MLRPEANCQFPSELCQILATSKINIPFLTFAKKDNSGSLSIVVDISDAEKTSSLIDENFTDGSCTAAHVVILSVFPHRNNPEIIGSLLDLLSQLKDHPLGIANSPSAVSVVLKRDSMGQVTNGLFESFQFSAYRTPDDWKLAQKGKEEIYKEVMASYQEKKPKIYGLEWQGKQEFLQVKMNGGCLDTIGRALKECVRSELALNYMVTGPGRENSEVELCFCLPEFDRKESAFKTMQDLLPEATTVSRFPTTYFTMNGPHFGDRDGIAARLFAAFAKDQVRLLGLSCSIASITGILPTDQTDLGINVIKKCFDVPSVFEKPNCSG